jgi:hypothetical protein
MIFAVALVGLAACAGKDVAKTDSTVAKVDTLKVDTVKVDTVKVDTIKATIDGTTSPLIK